MSHYTTLGVKPDCSQEAIKKSFRKLSKEHHPDLGGKADEFKKYSEAYDILSDPEKRAHYDEVGDANSLDELDKEILAHFNQLLQMVFQGFAAIDADWKTAIKNSIKEVKHQAENEVTKCTSNLEKIEKVIKKVDIKQTRQNIFKLLALDAKKQLEAQLQASTHRLKVAEACLERFELYKFSADGTPQLPNAVSYFGTWTVVS